MRIREGNRNSLSVIALFFILVALACGPADESFSERENGLLVIEGPWPASVEGRFEIAEISDAGGEDYIAFGWIETSKGTLPVHVFGQVLENGGAENGGKIHAKVRPSSGVADSYDIIEIRRIP